MPKEETNALRLPKQIDADPRGPALLAGLLGHRQPLWPGASLPATRADLTPELLSALVSARSAGRVTRGLEDAGQALAGEQRGLQIADERAALAGGGERGQRVSRLFILSNDGAERFYRHVESLLRRHEPRILAVRVDASATELGDGVLGHNTLARLLLVSHRVAVANVLLSLAGQWPDILECGPEPR